MPRNLPWEGSRGYRATSSLTRAPLVTILLLFSSYLATPSRNHASPRLSSCCKHRLPSAGTIERYSVSAYVQTGSYYPQRYSKSHKKSFSKKTEKFSYGGSQRRWFLVCRAPKDRSESMAAKSATPSRRSELTSSSEADSISLQIRREDEHGAELDGGTPFSNPFYEVVERGSGLIKHNTDTRSHLSREIRAQLQAQLGALEKETRESNVGQDADKELQDAIETENREDFSTEAHRKGSPEPTEQELVEQIRYLRTVRELENKLENARHKLHVSMEKSQKRRAGAYWQEGAYRDQEKIEMMDLGEVDMTPASRPTVKLKKEDFLGLVDLYFYSHRSRFLSESPDTSPTPLQLDDYSFQVSEDFSPPTSPKLDLVRDEEGTPVSPLYHVEAEIKNRKLNEIRALQNFVDLLLDDFSPLKDLFQAYKALPQPGVSYLSAGVIRLFLQRMSTPWRASEKAMLRYLSLLDDMQLVGLPITAWEWSSAIYLSGQSLSNVSNSDVAAAFRVWRQMEKEAGVAARDVTFNILFDIAAKANKFVLAEEVLREMHDRGFRLNRLGRVSLIYYYGKRGDGDAVRKAYRDFVEAGEIVDTLVLNCVMASLINAQEPTAAEQIYERMKGMQERLRKGTNADGEEALFLRYPPPGPETIGTEIASNALGRVLLNASRLKIALPKHHAELQNVMPLTPDSTTYRTLMFHHAKTSGNIDRLTVLLDDMTRQFRIPMTHLTFQFLFRGFAMHGGSERDDAKWTQQRLQIAWTACLVCLKAGRAKTVVQRQQTSRLDLPSVKDAEAMAAEDEKRISDELSRKPKQRKPSAWEAFIKQFTTPYPKTDTFDLYSTSLDVSEPQVEEEAGPGEEYVLPRVSLRPKMTSSEDTADMNPIQPNKHLVLWAIRAFTRCTASRPILEDLWHELTRVWRPSDFGEKAVAMRELRRALRYCDTHGRK